MMSVSGRVGASANRAAQRHSSDPIETASRESRVASRRTALHSPSLHGHSPSGELAEETFGALCGAELRVGMFLWCREWARERVRAQ
jgi:hypothetical protein